MTNLAENIKQTDFGIHQWIKKCKKLPVFPSTIVNIIRLIDSTDSNVSQIADLIRHDISLSAAILRITNSAAFGFVGKVTSIEQAIMLLGFKMVKNISLGVAVFNIFPIHDKYFLSKVWQRSILTALAARELCGSAGKKEDAFTIGLLHDIGLLAFYIYDNKKALELLAQSENMGRMSLNNEKNLMGIDHVEAGKLLAEHWKLPEDITIPIMHHHEEPKDDVYFPTEGNLYRVVYLASLVGDIFYLGKKAESIVKFKVGCQRLLGMSDYDSDQLLKNIHPDLVEVATCFDINIEPGHTYEDILSSVNDELLNVIISDELMLYKIEDSIENEKILSVKLEEANRNLKRMASRDYLTGLLNRHALNKLLEKVWKISESYGYPLSVIIADIDNFKSINDTHGHQAGDMVLKKVTEVLSKNLRKNDYLARYGGEEFLFVLPQSDLDNARRTAERIIAEVRKEVISLKNYQKLFVTISCGVSTANPRSKPENADALIQSADKALYVAKNSGKDRVVCNEDDNIFQKTTLH